MRESECYALECFRCHKEVEVEVEVEVKPPYYCPGCGQELEIEWRK